MHARLYWDRRSPAVAASLLTAFETQNETNASICRLAADAAEGGGASTRIRPIPYLSRASLLRIGAVIAAVALLAFAVEWAMNRAGHSEVGLTRRIRQAMRLHPRRLLNRPCRRSLN